MAEFAGIYRRRRPETTPLYKIVSENLETFVDTYEERFLERYGFLSDRAVEALRRYLKCGLLQHGFARVRCPVCRSEFAVAFSCQARGPCPSCGQKRVEVWSHFVIDDVVEDVPHRQFVFVIPKRFRCFFGRDGEMIGVLCRTMNKALTSFYRTGLGRPKATPGMLCSVQLFGDRLNPHVHLHVVATDGAFDEGRFLRLPVGPEDLAALERLFAEAVFSELIHRGKITPAVREDMLRWRHFGGFSVDASVRVGLGDKAALARLLRYVGRPPIANDRVRYDRATGEVTLFSAKRLRGQRRVVATYKALDFLALLALQVPPKGCHVTRYYGFYSSRSRASRREKNDTVQESTATVSPDAPAAKERRRRWAQMIRLVFEVDPLRCSKCGAQMRIVSFITSTQQHVIDRILEHLKVEIVAAPSTGPPLWIQIRQAQAYYADNPDVLPKDDLGPPHPPDEAYVLDEIYPDD